MKEQSPLKELSLCEDDIDRLKKAITDSRTCESYDGDPYTALT